MLGDQRAKAAHDYLVRLGLGLALAIIGFTLTFVAAP